MWQSVFSLSSCCSLYTSCCLVRMTVSYQRVGVYSTCVALVAVGLVKCLIFLDDNYLGRPRSTTTFASTNPSTMAAPLSGMNAIVVGATSGIGQAIAIRLASQGVSVNAIGRNVQAGQATVEQMKAASTNPSAEYQFTQMDASLLSNVHKFAQEQDGPVNYLVFCNSIMSFGGRNETAEGHEMKLALNVYSRTLLAHELAPKMQMHSGVDGEAHTPRVMSVFSGGVHGPFTDWSDMGLKTTFTLLRCADAAGFYTDCTFDHMAQQHPGIGYMHFAPGFVVSKLGYDTSWAPLIKAAHWLFGRTSEKCAQIAVDALLDERYATGFHPVNRNGAPTSVTSQHTPSSIAKVVEHFNHVFATTLGDAFSTPMQ
eukprot:m.24835 g.24835  ORF g.24835 m.24835 type:complete len:369 (+) comp8642_c0_seq3:36-1142(+)